MQVQETDNAIKVFTEPNFLPEKLKNVRLLLVGAGGIGCEVLKNLVLSGFTTIEVIDLDTIEVSNLNRQFLFQREHVGKPKALVAKETALKFAASKVDIVAHHGSIFDKQFGVTYFEQFNIVINALDNVKARSHVNRMCLAADVPLIETGSAGYVGQVEFFRRDLTQCYDCTQKAKQKTFPGCTIRNTPSEPIHCIVWAKHLFNQLFGEYDHEDEVSPDTEDAEATEEATYDVETRPPPKMMRLSDNGKDASNSVTSSSTANKESGDGNITRVNTRLWAHENNYDPEKLFQKFFVDDINYLLSMRNLWKQRKPPVPCAIDVNNIDDNAEKPFVGVDRLMKVWTVDMCGKVFADCCKQLRDQLKTKSEGEFLIWDKDDDIALDFVTACANIRSYIFDIAAKSRFDIKALAGNIIPAIATTNSIVAGVAVLYTINVLVGCEQKNKTSFLRKYPNARGILFGPDRELTKRNPDCLVCSSAPQITVVLDVNRVKVRELESLIIKDHLNMIAPDVTLGDNIVISSEEGETDENLEKTLAEMKFSDGCVILCDDFLQEYKLSITIRHKAHVHDAPLFETVLKQGASIREKATEGDAASSNEVTTGKSTNNEANTASAQDDDDNDIMELIEDATSINPSTSTSPLKKRIAEQNDVVDTTDDLMITE